MKGVPHNSDHCPIANVLKQQCGSRWAVGRGWYAELGRDTWKEYTLPEVVESFRRELDDLAYPDLICHIEDCKGS